jgi:hypothetical protein
MEKTVDQLPSVETKAERSTEAEVVTRKGSKSSRAKEVSLVKDKEWEKDHKMVRGMFKYYEIPGGTMNFVFGKYKGDPIYKYNLKDGEIIDLPLMVAKHLNNNCWYPVHAHLQDDAGNISMKVGRKVHRCGFQSLDFMDEADEVPSIMTVEKIK